MNTQVTHAQHGRRSGRVAAVGLFMAFAAFAGAAPALAGNVEEADKAQASNSHDGAQGPEGSWLYTVTGLDSTGFAFSFKGTETYAAGGGYTEADQLGFSPGTLAQPGHGAWKITDERKFLLTYVNLTYNADGSQAGNGKVRQTTKLSANGDSYTGSGDYLYYGPDGGVIDQGTFTITAKRIQVEAPAK